jgi:DNA-directed RNA polymerase specialized sigma subunit
MRLATVDETKMKVSMTEEEQKVIQDRIDYNLRKYHGRLAISREELAQNCWLEVMKMMPHYDPAKAKLCTFVGRRITGSILDQLRWQARWEKRHQLLTPEMVNRTALSYTIC